jgi:hypothetical protein
MTAIVMELIYQVSPKIEALIQQAEDLNGSLVASLQLLKPQSLTFDSLVGRITYCFAFSNIPMAKREVSELLQSRIQSYSRRKPNIMQAEILTLFDIYSSSYWDFYGTGKPIPAGFFISAVGKMGRKTKRIKGLSRKLRKILLIQKSGDHPLVVASLLYILIQKDSSRTISKHNNENLRAGTEKIYSSTSYQGVESKMVRDKLFGSLTVVMSHLAFWAVLTSFGMTGGSAILLEEVWSEDYSAYQYAYKTALERENATVWIEYFLKSYIEASRRVLLKLETGDSKLDPSSSSFKFQDSSFRDSLTERQKAILAMFVSKSREVTNKNVQRSCKVSQLTASRELSGLVRTGHIKIHGRGRATYYTRI